jgi:hypothetical protein
MPEVVALPEHGLALFAGQGEDEAVAEKGVPAGGGSGTGLH